MSVEGVKSMLDQVISALGLESEAELMALLGVHRCTIWTWRRQGIPARRRFQFAEMIQAKGKQVPKGLLAPKAA